MTVIALFTYVENSPGALARYGGVFDGYFGKERVMVFLDLMQKRVTVATGQVAMGG